MRETRTQRAHMHAFRLQFTIHAFRKRYEIGLGRTVAVVARADHTTCNRRHIDDAPEAPFTHQRREEVAHVRHGREHQFEEIGMLGETRLLEQIRS